MLSLNLGWDNGYPDSSFSSFSPVPPYICQAGTLIRPWMLPTQQVSCMRLYSLATGSISKRVRKGGQVAILYTPLWSTLVTVSYNLIAFMLLIFGGFHFFSDGQLSLAAGDIRCALPGLHHWQLLVAHGTVPDRDFSRVCGTRSTIQWWNCGGNTVQSQCWVSACLGRTTARLHLECHSSYRPCGEMLY